MRYNVTASVLSGLSTTISGGTGAFSALKLAGTGLAGGVLASSITGAIGLISTVTGIASTIATSRDQINQKIDTYQHQSSNVNGSSDLSVFEAYGQNKLLRIDYNMPEEIKTPVLDYFRKFGYHTDEYAIPNFSTRVYSDFVVCEPVFKASYIDSDFLDDITEKCKAGLRVFHYHDDGIYYDTTFSFENWETSLND